mgnify:CR=1 FL=1
MSPICAPDTDGKNVTLDCVYVYEYWLCEKERALRFRQTDFIAFCCIIMHHCILFTYSLTSSTMSAESLYFRNFSLFMGTSLVIMNRLFSVYLRINQKEHMRKLFGTYTVFSTR